MTLFKLSVVLIMILFILQVTGTTNLSLGSILGIVFAPTMLTIALFITVAFMLIKLYNQA